LIDINLSRTPDPDPYPFWDQVQATGGQNYSQWSNRVASEMLEQARITTDIEERTRLLRNFQLIFEDEMPAIPLFLSGIYLGADNSILGFRMGPLFDTSIGLILFGLVPGDKTDSKTEHRQSASNKTFRGKNT
jgi:peptide/nickel transport system substrate-binding protein